jgi:parallel beta-helix repeat protein
MKQVGCCLILLVLGIKVYAGSSDTVNVKTFGIDPNSQSNSSAKINSAISLLKNNQVLYFPDGVYNVDMPLQLKSNIEVFARHAVLKQINPNSPIFIGNGVNNVKITGLSFNGIGSDYVNTGNYSIRQSAAVYIDGVVSQNIEIKDCVIVNFGYAGIHVAANNFKLINNQVTGPVKYIKPGQNFNFGIVIGYNSSNGLIYKNKIIGTGQGIYFDPNIQTIKISDNEIFDVQQHGIYDAGGQDITIEKNIVKNATYCGIKVQLQFVSNNNDIARILIDNNTIINPGSHGILAININPETSKYRLRDIQILNNIISKKFDVGDSGIGVIKCSHVNIEKNTITNGEIGILARDATNVIIKDNKILKITLMGISLQSESDYTEKSTADSLKKLTAANHNESINITQTKDVDVENNSISLAPSSKYPQRYSIYEGNISNLHKANNVIQ